jgi:phospholipid transport system substrate-binding protein
MQFVSVAFWKEGMMITVSTRRSVLAMLALSALAPTVARADVVRGSPDRFVAGLADRVMAALADRSASTADRLHRVDALVADGFDLDRIARIALGRFWKTASEAERQEFATLFKAYVLTGYSRRFNDYAQRRLRVVAAKPAGEDMTVESYVEGGPTPIRLDWRLAATDQGWRVLDVMVEGVSLLLTYRNEFATVIEQSGGHLAGLIDELRSRVAVERAQAAS